MQAQPNKTRGIVAGDAERLQFRLGEIAGTSAATNIRGRRSLTALRQGCPRTLNEAIMLEGPSVLGRIKEKAGEYDGMELEKIVHGRDLIDAGCGHQNLVSTIREAHALGAKNYVGI